MPSNQRPLSLLFSRLFFDSEPSSFATPTVICAHTAHGTQHAAASQENIVSTRSSSQGRDYSQPLEAPIGQNEGDYFFIVFCTALHAAPEDGWLTAHGWTQCNLGCLVKRVARVKESRVEVQAQVQSSRSRRLLTRCRLLYSRATRIFFVINVYF
ncbi:hypothetical protein HYFRA_00006872 [Hymenoscyphus fraxineus]|uniref:Uncharacterized protein n=1 Tax=Hymenoscyphus fraxineus TaxID=746836 RepID=A0A9N9KN47_9HELO|nr:hypothetical protein HYFRA_00006872 [Hymenoscyphus fraxineus]